MGCGAGKFFFFFFFFFFFGVGGGGGGGSEIDHPWSGVIYILMHMGVGAQRLVAMFLLFIQSFDRFQRTFNRSYGIL